jgi:hypothetical protein
MITHTPLNTNTQNNQAIVYQRYEKVSYHLEREAYTQQMKARTSQLKHFLPCAKALVFTAAMGNMGSDASVASAVIADATRTPCGCHPALSEKDLWDLYYQAIEETPSSQDITQEEPEITRPPTLSAIGSASKISGVLPAHAR